MRFFAALWEKVDWAGLWPVWGKATLGFIWPVGVQVVKQDYHSWYFGINVGDVSHVDNSRDLLADLVSQIEGVFTFMLLLDEQRTLLFNLPF